MSDLLVSGQEFDLRARLDVAFDFVGLGGMGQHHVLDFVDGTRLSAAPLIGVACPVFRFFALKLEFFTLFLFRGCSSLATYIS